MNTPEEMALLAAAREYATLNNERNRLYHLLMQCNDDAGHPELVRAYDKVDTQLYWADRALHEATKALVAV